MYTFDWEISKTFKPMIRQGQGPKTTAILVEIKKIFGNLILCKYIMNVMVKAPTRSRAETLAETIG